MLKLTQYGLFILCIKSQKNKPTPKNESGLIISDNLIIAQFLVNQNINFIQEVFKYETN